MNLVSFIDPELAEAIEGEKARQNLTIELIASENFVPEVILEAQGSVLTNKYAEGYPGKRYHGGCRFIDVVESLAIERAKTLFGAEHANVQPHSGVNANLAVFMAMLEPGDVILGMDLRHGGHLSHGTAVNISGKFFRAFSYGVDRETGRIDYDEAERLALEHRPKMIIAGGSAYPRVIDFARFAGIADKVGAYFLVDMAHIAGLVAAGVHPSPVPHAHFVTFTTTKTMRGARGGNILCRKEFASRIDKAIFPGIQGGPIPQIMAGKALTFRLAMTEDFRNYGRRTVENAARFASVLTSRGFSLVSGGTDKPPDAGGPPQQGAHGQGSRRSPPCRRDHGEHEPHPLRPGKAHRHQRHPHRSRGRHKPGLHRRRRGGNGPHRRRPAGKEARRRSIVQGEGSPPLPGPPAVHDPGGAGGVSLPLRDLL